MKSTTILTLAVLAGISSSQAALININLTAGGPAPLESSLEGPAGGLGTSWNQYAGSNSPGTLVDSTGAATTVTMSSNFGLNADDTVTPLTMLYQSRTNFGKGVDNTTVTLSGLAAGGLYDVWMVSLRNQPFGADGTEQYVGWWSTTNTTTSAGDQLVNAVNPSINASTFVDGYNYVLFENVEADGGGNIFFTGVAGDQLDGSDNNHRFGLNGIQINEVPEPGSAALLALGGLLALRRRR